MEPYVAYYASNAAVALDRAQLMRSILLHMISMAELRDPSETGSHVNRVGGYSVEIFEAWARKKGLAKEEIERRRDLLRMAAMLHDVGKVAISDTILKKPARLDEDEYRVMKTHTWLGARLFADTFSEWEEASRDVALNHHEKFDGTGYPGHIDPFTGEASPGKTGPDGLPVPKRGDEIPLFGRIVALADVYDALASRRSYKEAWSEERVLEVIREESGRHFDPDVVDAFLDVLPSIRAIGSRYE
jgi:HD-GYP domain-containing protein (c-di-GMP phosphodiesterase class II)